ncbi:hypothetical protein PC123_g14773 [Phytophthora cactorum]|nr:hypothetical protein PC120_g15313 [Phytophthora cactorum]KAG4049975.1 hypothetical protein PC123_g14773 [Phytophthora cactorum]
MQLENPPTSAPEMTSIPAMSWMCFAKYLYDESIEQICILSDLDGVKSEAEELRQLHAASTTESENTLSAKAKKERFNGQIWGLAGGESLLRCSTRAQGCAPGRDSCGASAGQGHTARG